MAQWLAALAQQGSLRAGDFLGIAAEHFEQAGDEPSAVEFHARAAEQAGQRFAHERVLVHVGRALVLLGNARAALPDEAALHWRLLSARERTLYQQARRSEQVVDLDAMARLADLLDDDRRRAEVAFRRGMYATRVADWAAMESAARLGIACAARAGDDQLRLHFAKLLASAKLKQGNIDAGRTLALEALTEARSLGLRQVESSLLNTLLNAANMQGDLAGRLDLNRQSLQIAREAGDRVGEAFGLLNFGGGWLDVGDLAQARRDIDAGRQMMRAQGDKTMEGAAHVSLSTLALWQGDVTRALALARQALDIFVAAQARDWEGIARLRLGDAEEALGRLDAAREAYGQAHTRALEIGSAWRHDASAGLARVALAAGDTAAAMAALKPLLDHVAAGGTMDGTDYPRQIELTCHLVLVRAGDPRASNWLALAHGELMAQAEALADTTLRQGFLQNIPYHRAVVEAWAQRDESRAKPAV